jgi:hypothetical protein
VRPIPSPAGETHCLALLKPWKPIGKQKARFRVEFDRWIFTARSPLNVILLSASPSLSCRSMGLFVSFTLFKMVKMVSQEIERLQNLNYAQYCKAT